MPLFAKNLTQKASKLLSLCEAQGLTIGLAESCTGGLLAALLTSISGASKVFESGFVTYSNAAKTTLLGVKEDVLFHHGAVSFECAEAMLQGVFAHSNAGLGLAITGIAGPMGGSFEKPVGLVHIAAKKRQGNLAHLELRLGNKGRETIRLAATASAVDLLLQQASL